MIGGCSTLVGGGVVLVEEVREGLSRQVALVRESAAEGGTD